MRANTVFFFLLSCLFILSGCETASNTGNPWNRAQTSAPNTQQPQPGQSGVYPQGPGQLPPIDRAKPLPPVKIALLLPLTGSQADLGQSMLQAAQLALFDVGYEAFELLPHDTGGTPQGAVIAAKSALDDGAQMILGPLFAEAAKAVKPVAAARGVNMITFSTDWTLAGGNAYVMGFLPFAQVQRVTRYVAASGIRDVAVLAPRDRYGDAVVQTFEQNAYQNAITIKTAQRFDPRQSDLNPVVQVLSGYDATVPKDQYMPPYSAVFMPMGGAMAAQAGSALSFYGLPPRKIRRFGTGLLDNASLARDPNLNGAWFAAPSPRARQNFENRYLQTFGEKPARLATLSYDATALASVLAITGFQSSGKPAFDTRALTNPNGFGGIDGIFRFQSNGIVERGLAVLEYRGGRIVEIDPAPTTFQTYKTQ